MTAFVERLQLGPANGLRVAIKDTIDIAGYCTRAGSRALADAPPAAANAKIVELLLNAGCRIVGKTVLHELAFGVTGINDYAGTPRNPHFPDRVPGGSSSGSAAAVAEGSAEIGIGTDTGGSIRIPAACCGVWGLKPTFGRVSRLGVMPRETTLDCVGPFARDLAHIVRAMEILSPGFGPITPGKGRIAVLKNVATPEIEARVNAAVAASGLEAIDAVFKHMDAAFAAGLTVINVETWRAAGHFLASGLIGADVGERIKSGANVTAAMIETAETVRKAFSDELDALFASVDALVLPTLPVPVLTLEQGRENRTAVPLTRLVRPFNLSGHPALAMPLAPIADGPVSLQIVGPKGGDELVCAIACRFAGRV